MSAKRFGSGLFNLPSTTADSISASIVGDWFYIVSKAGCAVQATFAGPNGLSVLEDLPQRQMYLGAFENVTLSTARWISAGSIDNLGLASTAQGASGYYLFGTGTPPPIPSIEDTDKYYSSLAPAVNTPFFPTLAAGLSTQITLSTVGAGMAMFGDPWQYAVTVYVKQDAPNSLFVSTEGNGGVGAAIGVEIYPGMPPLRFQTGAQLFLHNPGAGLCNYGGFIERLR